MFSPDLLSQILLRLLILLFPIWKYKHICTLTNVMKNITMTRHTYCPHHQFFHSCNVVYIYMKYMYFLFTDKGKSFFFLGGGDHDKAGNWKQNCTLQKSNKICLHFYFEKLTQKTGLQFFTGIDGAYKATEKAIIKIINKLFFGNITKHRRSPFWFWTRILEYTSPLRCAENWAVCF